MASLNSTRYQHFLRSILLFGEALVAVCSTVFFLVSGFLGLAAWSDYNSRGCTMEWGQQCNDANDVMKIAAIMSPISLAISILLYWLSFRTFRRARR